jgi:hypothetical protein
MILIQATFQLAYSIGNFFPVGWKSLQGWVVGIDGVRVKKIARGVIVVVA